MCHYIADSICHPFVYGRIQFRTDKKKSECHGLHAALENDIDAILLWKFKHKKPSEFNQAASLCLNTQESQFVSRYLSRCINRTYYQITEKNNFQVTVHLCDPLRKPDPVRSRGSQDASDRIRGIHLFKASDRIQKAGDR